MVWKTLVWIWVDKGLARMWTTGPFLVAFTTCSWHVLSWDGMRSRYCCRPVKRNSLYIYRLKAQWNFFKEKSSCPFCHLALFCWTVLNVNCAVFWVTEAVICMIWNHCTALKSFCPFSIPYCNTIIPFIFQHFYIYNLVIIL